MYRSRKLFPPRGNHCFAWYDRILLSLIATCLKTILAASTYPGAQIYVSFLTNPNLVLILLKLECAQINVTGGGTKVPAGVSFPGAYKGTDPGITINIYVSESSF
jgi:hypothetical protein